MNVDDRDTPPADPDFFTPTLRGCRESVRKHIQPSGCSTKALKEISAIR
jgi:hypothetical protein